MYLYTQSGSTLQVGTDDGMCVTSDTRRRLKWKPPHENSVDFKLELKSPEQGDFAQPDLHA
jgi:hypothetical protein